VLHAGRPTVVVVGAGARSVAAAGKPLRANAAAARRAAHAS